MSLHIGFLKNGRRIHVLGTPIDSPNDWRTICSNKPSAQWKVDVWGDPFKMGEDLKLCAHCSRMLGTNDQVGEPG